MVFCKAWEIFQWWMRDILNIIFKETRHWNSSCLLVHSFFIRTRKIYLRLIFLIFKRFTSLKMLLFCSYLKSILFVLLAVYTIIKMIVNITFLAFLTRCQVVQDGNRFSVIIIVIDIYLYNQYNYNYNYNFLWNFMGLKFW